MQPLKKAISGKLLITETPKVGIFSRFDIYNGPVSLSIDIICPITKNIAVTRSCGAGGGGV